jgi:serine protease Do
MFDEQVVRLDPKVRPLLDQFVCVRMIQANGIDLSLFQFDYDLTFSAFFLNSDRTIYGRYGSRSSEQGNKDVSVEGFAQALQSALEFHKGYPQNKEELSGKQPKPAKAKHPEDYASLKGKYTTQLDWNGKVVASCIHCHMVGEAQRLSYRNQRQQIPEELLFPYPMPDALGIHLSARDCGVVEKLKPQSPASKAGLLENDKILTLNGERILSTADVQWVLQNSKPGEALKFGVVREGHRQSLSLTLPEKWREADENGWRVGFWDMRRMALGGMFLKSATPDERRAINIHEGKMALRAEHVGEYGEHAVAKKAGLRRNDIVIAIGDHEEDLTEPQAIAMVLRSYAPGETLKVRALREGKELQFEFPVQ